MNDAPEQPNSTPISTDPTPGNNTGPVPDAPVAEAPLAPPVVEGQAVESAAPLTLADITLPDGFVLAEEDATEFFGLVEKDMTAKERAAALVGFHTKQLEKGVQAAADEYARQWTETEETWKKEIQTAFPGPKLEAAQSNIAKVLDRYGTKEVREAFTATGAGNNPHIFTFLNKIAADLVERPPVQGTPSNSAPLSRADRMFQSGVKTNG